MTGPEAEKASPYVVSPEEAERLTTELIGVQDRKAKIGEQLRKPGLGYEELLGFTTQEEQLFEDQKRIIEALFGKYCRDSIALSCGLINKRAASQ
jgi:hypothetical protein